MKNTILLSSKENKLSAQYCSYLIVPCRLEGFNDNKFANNIFFHIVDQTFTVGYFIGERRKLTRT